MSEETKEVVRLLYESMDEIRLHEKYPDHVTNQGLKDKFLALLRKHNIDEPGKAVEMLCFPPERTK